MAGVNNLEGWVGLAGGSVARTTRTTDVKRSFTRRAP